MSSFQHVCIRASAGSGKTYRLAHRFIDLLAAGVPAERIIAMTFSRAAAGEIFDNIIKYLRQGATSDKGAAEENKALSNPIPRTRYLELLQDLLAGMHRLHVGTLDSFTVSIIKAFPFELGVPARFSMMDNEGFQARQARQVTLDGLFDPAAGEDTHRAFFEAFKQATFGREEKRLHGLLEEYIQRNHALFAEYPNPATWGAANRIWPQGSPLLQPIQDPAGEAETLLTFLHACDWQAAPQGNLREFVEAAALFNEQSRFSDLPTTKNPVNKLFDALDELREGHFTFKFGKHECTLPETGCQALYKLLHHVAYIVTMQSLRETAGIGSLMGLYEGQYDLRVRRAGLLSFLDTQYLLCGRTPSRTHAQDRLYIDYRLDARLDHWLWDEFQDTSDLQWEVLSGLIDEVIQDPEQRRSFFFVGDTKQAIYGWRGGNARLFDEILDSYQGAFQQEVMNDSYRTAQPVLDLVNRVFSSLEGFGFPESTMARWNPFPPHTSAFPDRPGYTALLEPPCTDPKDKPTAEDFYEVTAQLIRELRPHEKGLSVGVLVRTNKQAIALADTLRAADIGMSVALEGESFLADNVAVELMLCLLQLAAHPDDRTAREYLLMSPLAKHLPDAETTSPAFLRQIQDLGLHGFIKIWCDRLAPSSRFEQQRLRHLLETARTSDHAGMRHVDDFIQTVRHTSIPSSEVEQAVRVMTVHKSKGLGFDLVILPDLMGGSMLTPRQEGMIKGEEWILSRPKEWAIQMDPQLSALVDQKDADDILEDICALYVAMTRAKSALYLVTGYPGKASRAISPAHILKELLTGETKQLSETSPYTILHQEGDPNWHQHLADPESSGAARVAIEPLPNGYAERLLEGEGHEPESPSQIDRSTEEAGLLFSGRETYFELGTAVHELFEAVEWSGEADPEATAVEWKKTTAFSPDIAAEAISHFKQAVQSPGFHQALAKPDGHAVCWREKAFNLLLDGQWLNGIMDRVVLVRNETGAYQSAIIQDYKTNRIEKPAELDHLASHYTVQLKSYRSALAQLTGLPEGSIRLQLLFTRAGKVIEVA